MSRGHVRPYGCAEQAIAHHHRARATVFKELGTTAHLAGSHFAMLWINPAGEAEVVASEALYGHLEHLFTPEAVERAKQATIASHSRTYAGADEHRISLIRGSVYDAHGRVVQAYSADDGSESGAAHSQHGDSSTTSPRLPLSPHASEPSSIPSVLMTYPSNLAVAQQQASQLDVPRERHPSAASSLTEPRTPKRSAGNSQITSPTSTASSNQAPGTARGTRSRKSLSLDSSQSPLLDGPIDVEPLTLSPETIGDWFSKRLEIIPQQVSKTIAKLWVKVIEPEKQSFYPYNRGDAGAPPWWPRSIRHKEPDHLYKVERITLLATLIRCTRRPIEDFEDALGKRFSQIPDLFLPILVDLIKVAREERKAIEASPNGTFEYITVLVTPQSAALNNTGSTSVTTSAFSSGLTRSTSFRTASELTPRARSNQPYSLVRSPSAQESSFADASLIPTSKSLSRSQSLTSRASREKTPTSAHRRKRTSVGGVSEIAELDNRLQAVTALQSPATNSMGPSPASIPKSSSMTSMASPTAPARPANAFPSVLEPAFASPAMIRSRSQLATMGHAPEGGLKSIDETFDEYGRRVEPTLRRQTGTIASAATGAAIALKPYSPYTLGPQLNVSGPVIHPAPPKRPASVQSQRQDEPAPPTDRQASYRHLSANSYSAGARPSPVLYQDPTFTSTYTSMRELSPAFTSNVVMAEQYCPPVPQQQQQQTAPASTSHYYWTPESLDGSSLPSLSPAPDNLDVAGNMASYRHHANATVGESGFDDHFTSHSASTQAYSTMSGPVGSQRIAAEYGVDVWDSPFYGAESGPPIELSRATAIPAASDQWVYGRSVSGSYM
ncbi:hypothetical protein ACM66B_002312 [Microbotryomycetes sp. NB124-2]